MCYFHSSVGRRGVNVPGTKFLIHISECLEELLSGSFFHVRQKAILYPLKIL